MSRLALLGNALTRNLSTMFPGYFAEVKRNHYADFSFPTQVTFKLAHDAYCRNGIARAGVDKTVAKTWQENPLLQERQRDGSEPAETKGETAFEGDIRQRLDDLRVWQHLAEADRRSMVGSYSGLILRLADNKRFDQPADSVPGGLLGLVEIIPAWEGQLEVSTWQTDELADDYGQPTMYQFNEASVGFANKNPRQFSIHPSRVIVWSKDGTLNGRSALEPGFNDLITMEKISGAGGEGFWKNAKSAPVLQVAPDASIDKMAQAMGVPVEEVRDRMDTQVQDWQRGFDQLLMIQGMEAKTLGVTLPSPEHFFAIALQSFSASMSIPLKILVGSQSGERASTEDADEWAQTNMARRTNQAVPNIRALIQRLEEFGILPERDWHLDWPSLLDPSPKEMLERVERMATVNDKMRAAGETVFTGDEMRAEFGREPLSDAERFRDEPGVDDERDALDLPTPEDEPAAEA